MHKLAYRIDDAAEVVGFSRSTLYKDIQSGDLKTICRGRSRRITHVALETYLRMLQARSAGAAAPNKAAAERTDPVKRPGKAVRL